MKVFEGKLNFKKFTNKSVTISYLYFFINFDIILYENLLGDVVEIDESAFGVSKYHRGRSRPIRWVYWLQ